MSTEPSQPLNRQILDEAADWLVELNTGDAGAAAQQRFDAWLRASPEHVRAYLELLPLWEDGALPRPSAAADPEALIAWAKSADNVVPLSVTPSALDEEASASVREEAIQRVRSLSRRGFAVAASILLTCVATGTLTWLHFDRDPTYATDIGEQRSIALADGSTLEMNARSKVRIHFTETQRIVELLQGQALFLVAKDSARPFIVDSDGTRVRAVGTQFDVYRRKSGTTVTVLEGRVSVVHEASTGAAPRIATDGTAASEEILLSPGEQVTVTAAALPRPTRVNLAAATAWTQRRLVFDAATLAEVVEEFNRYNARRLVLRDAALERFPITAAFSSTDPASLVRFLEAQPGIRVTSTDDEIQISANP